MQFFVLVDRMEPKFLNIATLLKHHLNYYLESKYQIKPCSFGQLKLQYDPDSIFTGNLIYEFALDRGTQVNHYYVALEPIESMKTITDDERLLGGYGYKIYLGSKYNPGNSGCFMSQFNSNFANEVLIELIGRLNEITSDAFYFEDKLINYDGSNLQKQFENNAVEFVNASSLELYHLVSDHIGSFKRKDTIKDDKHRLVYIEFIYNDISYRMYIQYLMYDGVSEVHIVKIQDADINELIDYDPVGSSYLPQYIVHCQNEYTIARDITNSLDKIERFLLDSSRR